MAANQPVTGELVQERNYVSLAEAAAMLNCSHSAIYKWTKQGYLKPLPRHRRKDSLNYLVDEIRNFTPPSEKK